MNRAIFPAVTIALSGMVFAGVWTMTDPARAGAPPVAVAAIPMVEAASVGETARRSVADADTMPLVSRRAVAAVARRVKPVALHPSPRTVRLPVAESVFYPGCRAVRAAGAAPLYRGQPGYRRDMDGDDDGIACEPYRGG